MTVSLALRRSSRIRESTRKRIEAIAVEMGYRPNPMVSAHMSYLRAIKKVRPRAAIAFLSRWPKSEFLQEERHYNLIRMYRGASDRAESLGYSLEYHNFKDDEISQVRLNQILVNRGIEGLLFAQTGVMPMSDEIDWSRFAIAASQFSNLPFTPNRTMSDVHSMMQTLVSEVWALGYRRIGLALRKTVEIVLERRRLSAFLGAMNLRDPGNVPPFYLYEDDTMDEIPGWLGKRKPDVILTEYEICELLLGKGIGIPEDLGVALLNFPKRSLISKDKYCGYNHSFERVGATLIELIVEQLNLNQRGDPAAPKSVLIAGEWLSGNSLINKSEKS